jgi:hypothetical protein
LDDGESAASMYTREGSVELCESVVDGLCRWTCVSLGNPGKASAREVDGETRELRKTGASKKGKKDMRWSAAQLRWSNSRLLT